MRASRRVTQKLVCWSRSSPSNGTDAHHCQPPPSPPLGRRTPHPCPSCAEAPPVASPRRQPIPQLAPVAPPPLDFLARHPARLICAHSPHLSLAKTSHTHPNTAEENLAAEPVPVVHGRRPRRSRLNVQLRRHERNTDRPPIWRTVGAVNGGDPEQALTGDSQTQSYSGVSEWHRRRKIIPGFQGRGGVAVRIRRCETKAV